MSYIFIYVCVCVCVCVWEGNILFTEFLTTLIIYGFMIKVA